MKTSITAFLMLITLLIANNGYSLPNLFNNVMAFDNQNFGLIDFDGDQDSYAAINTYLSNYDAALTGGSFGDGQIVASYSWGHGVPTSNFLVGDNAYIKINFNTPIHAVGLFLSWYNTNRYNFKVTLSDGTSYSYNDIDANLPSTPYAINGFMGLTSDIGISYFEYNFNSDKMAIDSIYFGNTVSLDGLEEGPKNIPDAQADTIPLPNYNASSSSSAVPEPMTIGLLITGLIGITIRKRINA